MLKKLYNEPVIQALITVVSVIVLGFAVVVRGSDATGEQVTPPVLSDTTTTDFATGTPEPTLIPEETATPTATPTATTKPTASPTQDKTVASQDWLFPGAHVTQSFPDLKAETTTDPKVVTDWYKEKIKSLGMSTQTFVVTSTNDKIYNKLVAANSTNKIEATIERASSTSNTQITVVSTSVN